MNEQSSHAPDMAYADSPSVLSEISWVADAARDAMATTREYWLRKSALLDRIAPEETSLYTPEIAADAVQVAARAARRFVEYDVIHRGLSLKGADLVTDDDHRAYVRDAYREWRQNQPS